MPEDTIASKASRSPLNTRTGRGKELCEMLSRELCVPDGAKSFTVRFAAGELVTVTCEYAPRPKPEPNAE